MDIYEPAMKTAIILFVVCFCITDICVKVSDDNSKNRIASTIGVISFISMIALIFAMVVLTIIRFF